MGGDKILDHLNGKCCGAMHNQGNLDFQLPNHVLIFFHNLSMYLANTFVKDLGNTKSKINCIPNTDEKYISLSKQVGNLEMRFINLCRFILSRLDTLVKKPTKDQSATVKTRFDDRHELVIRKGIFPYEYRDGPPSWKRLSSHQKKPSSACSLESIPMMWITHTLRGF